MKLDTFIDLSQTIIDVSQTIIDVSQTITVLSQTIIDLSQTIIDVSQTITVLSQTITVLSQTIIDRALRFNGSTVCMSLVVWRIAIGFANVLKLLDRGSCLSAIAVIAKARSRTKRDRCAARRLRSPCQNSAIIVYKKRNQ